MIIQNGRMASHQCRILFQALISHNNSNQRQVDALQLTGCTLSDVEHKLIRPTVDLRD